MVIIKESLLTERKSTMTIRTELLDELLQTYQKPEDLMGENGILKELTKALLERALSSELTYHLGYEKHALEGKNSGNSRNGKSGKTLKGEQGELRIEIPEIVRENSSRN